MFEEFLFVIIFSFTVDLIELCYNDEKNSKIINSSHRFEQELAEKESVKLRPIRNKRFVSLKKYSRGLHDLQRIIILDLFRMVMILVEQHRLNMR